MNKYEFQQRLDEVDSLIAAGKYADAVREADELNLDLVTQPSRLQRLAKAYEKCRRYMDAEDLLLSAREHAPKSRGILFHLCTVTVKAGELDVAREYYEDFVRIAPRDTERFVLEYRIAKAAGEDTDKLTSILEAYREEEPDDQWMYTLAELYARSGQYDKALEVCNDIDIWFYSGKYVKMARALHDQLTAGLEGDDHPEELEVPQEKENGLREAEKRPAETEEELPYEGPGYEEAREDGYAGEPKEGPGFEEEPAPEEDRDGFFGPEDEEDEAEDEDADMKVVRPAEVLNGDGDLRERGENLDEGRFLKRFEPEKERTETKEEILNYLKEQRVPEEEPPRDEHVVVTVTSPVHIPKFRDTENAPEPDEEPDDPDENGDGGPDYEYDEPAALYRVDEKGGQVRARRGDPFDYRVTDDAVYDEDEGDEDEPVPEETEAALAAEAAAAAVAAGRGNEFGGLPLNPPTNEGVWHFVTFGETSFPALECARQHMKDIADRTPQCPQKMLKINAAKIGAASIIHSFDRFLGAMVIVEKAASLSDDQLREFAKVLDKDDRSLLVAFSDTRANVEQIFRRVPELAESFTAVFSGIRYSPADLLKEAKRYLLSQEAKLTPEAEQMMLEKAQRVLKERDGFYVTKIRQYAEAGLAAAENGGFLGFGGGRMDKNDGLMWVDAKHLRKVEE